MDDKNQVNEDKNIGDAVVDRETCGFMVAWVGPCKDLKPCAKHGERICTSCGAPATQECDSTGQFVCGEYLCDECEHTIFPDGTNGGVGFNAADLPEDMKRHCKRSEQRYLPWYAREKETSVSEDIKPNSERSEGERQNHSPLPWILIEDPSDYIKDEAESRFYIEAADGMTVAATVGDCVPEQAGNAALIVHRVNSFDTLVEALKEAADSTLSVAMQLDTWAQQSRDGGWSTHQVDPMLRLADTLRRKAARLQNALNPTVLATVRANARLLAAAPVLYEAALAAESQLSKFMRDDGHVEDYPIIAQLRSAIATVIGKLESEDTK